MRRFGHIALVWTLCVELALVAPTASAAAPPTAPPAPLGAVAGALLGAMPSAVDDPLAHAFEEPIIDWLRELPPIDLHVGLAPDDPALDLDPFFLRAQRWVAPRADADAGFEADATGFTLFLPNAPRAWRLDVPLRPLGFAGDYLWCVARDPAFFPTPDDADHGEGIFLVRLSEWRSAARTGAPVPLFYLPMPDTGWSGPRVAVADYAPDDAAILIDAFGDAQPVRIEDVDEVVAAETLNLTLALGTSARAAAHARALPTRLPLPRSTANFGTLFTGFDASGVPAIFETTPPEGARRLWQALHRLFGTSEAQAFGLEGAPAVSDKLARSLTRVGMVLAISTVAAVLLKYTLFRKHFRERRREKPKSWLGTVGREFREIGVVLAHKLTLLSSFAPVWFGHGTQYLVDRHLPSIGAGRNKRLFRLLDGTVYFMRKARKRLPVNDDTLVRGALVLGGISSLLTGARLYYAVPWLAEAYSRAVPAAATKVDAVFNLGNGHAESLARNETLRAFGTNVAGGASALSESTRQQYVSIFGPAVDEQLRKEGIDPLDEENHPLREARVEEKLRTVFEQMGLPIEEDLFNSDTLWAGGLALLGFAPPADSPARGPRYVASERPGLVMASLERTRRELARRVEATPDAPELRQALELVEATQRDARVFRGLAHTGLRAVGATLRAPLRSLYTGFRPAREAMAEGARLLRRTRQRLFALTQEGPLGHVEPAGDWIAEAGKSGASVAAHIFRRAFFGYLAGDDAVVKGPSEEDRLRIGPEETEQAQAAARRRLADRYLDEVEDDDGTKLVARHRVEYELLVEDEINDAVAVAREAARKFVPPRRGFFRRRQDRAAYRKAAARFEEERERPFDPLAASDDDQKAFRNYFTEASLEGMRLYPDYEGLEDLERPIAEAAEVRTKTQLASPKLAEWLKGLSPEDRATFEASTFAENFATIYVETTTGSVESVARLRYQGAHPEGKEWNPDTATKVERRWWEWVYAKAALAPGQPGRFQKFRQRTWVRTNRTVTRLVRAAESLFPVEAHAPGFWNVVYRNTPMLYDTRLAVELSARRFITAGLALYPAAYVFFGVTMPLHLWLLSQVFFFSVAGPYMTLNRFYRLQGSRPMATYKGVAGYALLGGIATMWGTFPMLLLAEDTKRLIEETLPCAAWLVKEGS